MATRPYPSFLVYFDNEGYYRWKLQAANHRIIADSGEGYTNYKDCLDAIKLIKSPHRVWQTKDVIDSLI